MEEGTDCICDEDKKRPQPEPVPVPAYQPEPGWWKQTKKVALFGAATGLAIATVAAVLCPFDGPLGDVALGSATASTWAAALAR